MGIKPLDQGAEAEPLAVLSLDRRGAGHDRQRKGIAERPSSIAALGVLRTHITYQILFDPSSHDG